MAGRTSDISKEGFLSYLNDTGEKIDGYFEIVEITEAYVKIRTKGNIILIPMHRILKIKIKEDKDGKN